MLAFASFRRIGWMEVLAAVLLAVMGGLLVAYHLHAQRAAERREQELAYLASIVEFSDNAIIGRSPEGMIRTWNRGAEKLYGYTAQEAIGQPITLIIPPDHSAELVSFDRLKQGRRVEQHETVRVGKGGRRIDVSVTISPVMDGVGRVIGASTVAHDITARKRAEEALQAERNRFNAVLDALPGIVLLLRPDYHIAFANRFYRERFGEPLGRSCYNLTFGRTEPCEDCQTFIPLKTGEPHHHEWVGPDNRTYQISAFPFTDTDGSPLLLEMGVDITERKGAEEALRRASAYNRTLIEASLDPLVTISPDGKVTDVNSATEKVTGRSRTELIGTDFSDYFTDPEKARAGYQQVFREGSVQDYALEVQHPDGHTVPVLYNASLYRDERGEVVGVFAAARDITARKRAEEAARRANAYNRSLIEASLDPLVTVNPEGRVTDVNEATINVTGVPREKLVGTDVANYFTEPERAREGYRLVFSKGFVTDYPLTIRHVDGHLTDVMYNASVYKDAQGNVLGLFAAARDITARKRAEEAARRANAYNRSLIEASLDPLVTISPDGKVTDVNSATEKVTGRTCAELIGTDFSNYFTDPAKARAGYQQVFREGSVHDYELEIRHRDGRLTPVLYNATVYRDESGGIGGVFAAARDITEKKRAQRVVEAERQRFNNMLEELPVYLVLLTPDYHVPFANGFFRERFGESKGRRCYEYLFGRQEPCEVCETFRVLKTGAPHAWEWTGPDGRNYEVSDFPFRDADGSPLILEMGIDVTERKRAEAEVRKLNESLEQRVRERTAELEAANKEMEAFTYSVSHDLRAPLRHVDGFSSLLSEEFAAQLPEDARHYVDRIAQGTRQMGQLVDDLLNLSRVGRTELRLQITGLGSLVEEIIGELKAENPDRPIEWRVGSLPYIECDPSLIKQVLTNLLSNAVKFTRPREAPVIEVGTRHQDGSEVVFVRDNGVGFSMKYADKLFGVFQRLHRSQDFEGTGVGLATVQRIVQKHGGRAWGEGELNQGATFYFTLPGMVSRERSKSASAA